MKVSCLLFSALVALCAPAFCVEYDMNELPMYGGQHDPQVKPDQAGSARAAELGWKYLDRGDTSTAMKRFNQAWMFDRENPKAFWGFGIIVGQRAKAGDTEKNIRESIKLLATAHELDLKNAKIMGDLAFSHTFLGHYLEFDGKSGKENYAKAEALFSEAYKLEPKYAPIVANYGVLKFYAGDILAAKKFTKEAELLGYTPEPAFLKELDAATAR